MNLFLTAIMGVSIAIVQPAILPTFALEVTQIGEIAKSVTVLVDGQNPGSGVIIGKDKTSYYVLTAKHVVATDDEYGIVTPDKQHYPLNYSQVKKLPNVDLAVVQFTSDRDYPVAQLNNSKSLPPGMPVHIYGFPNPGREIKERIPFFTPGNITATSHANDGYGLVYTNFTRAGMSGGPVLNSDGQVVGIHGRAESELDTSGNAVQTGVNLGIPISVFFDLAPTIGMDGILEQSTANATVQTPTIPKPQPIQLSPGGVPSRPTIVKPSVNNGDPVCAGRNC
jgi:S1-C subfamily serine protease